MTFFKTYINNKESCLFQGKTNKLKVEYRALSF